MMRLTDLQRACDARVLSFTVDVGFEDCFGVEEGLQERKNERLEIGRVERSTYSGIGAHLDFEEI